MSVALEVEGRLPGAAPRRSASVQPAARLRAGGAGSPEDESNKGPLGGADSSGRNRNHSGLSQSMETKRIKQNGEYGDPCSHVTDVTKAEGRAPAGRQCTWALEAEVAGLTHS